MSEQQPEDDGQTYVVEGAEAVTESGNVEWDAGVPEHSDDDPPAPFEEDDATEGDSESTDTGDPAADPAPAEDDSEVATEGGEGQ